MAKLTKLDQLNQPDIPELIPPLGPRTDLTDPTGQLKLTWEELITSDLPSSVRKIAFARITRQRLDNLKNSIKSCKLCDLRKFCRSPQPMTGPHYGPASPQPNHPGSCIIVTDYPGMSSDSLLAEAVRHYQIPIAAYITTAACTPPPSRPIKASEYSSCRLNLESQINFIHPWLIISLGAQTLKAFHPKLGVTQDRGKFFKTIINGQEYWVISTWNPGYVRRQITHEKKPASQCSSYREFRADLKLAATALNIATTLGGEIVDGIIQLVPHADKAGLYEPTEEELAALDQTIQPKVPKSLYLDDLDNLPEYINGLPEF